MIFLYDIHRLEWQNKEQAETDEFFIGFTNSEKGYAEFENLSYGIKLLKNNEIIAESYYPKENSTVLLATDQEWLETFQPYISPGVEYSFQMWAENSGVKTEHVYNFIGPIPKKPYESFLWNEEVGNWYAPIPFPDLDNDYIWDEASISWVIAPVE
jgi:hypothetical protein